MVTLLFVGCASMQKHHYPDPPEDPNKQWVLRQLTYMRDTHVRNRGAYNNPEFDDWCVEVYDTILIWVEENPEGEMHRFSESDTLKPS
jgi:hypothetical protein